MKNNQLRKSYHIYRTIVLFCVLWQKTSLRRNRGISGVDVFKNACMKQCGASTIGGELFLN
jgi:hypothetical protein